MKTENKTHHVDLTAKRCLCPKCGKSCPRHGKRTRRIVDLNRILMVTTNNYHCTKCARHFTRKTNQLANPGARFTHRVRDRAVGLVIKEGLTLEGAYDRMMALYNIRISPSTLHDWIVDEAYPETPNMAEVVA